MLNEIFKFKLFYKALAKKLKFFKKYLNEMFEKGQIRKLKLLINFLIIFIFKFNKKNE